VRRGRQAETERGSDVPIPGVEEQLAEALALALGRHHHVHAPRADDVPALDRQRDRHRRVLADDRRPFTGDPDQRIRGRVLRVEAVLPVPAQPAGFGRVRAEHAPVERIDRVAILVPEPVDHHRGLSD
jgi:hypothetical protein